ncbi:MAG: arylsulfatase [Phycisphaerae bacterium]|nr:arylsulfatase [Phycisphaerae bacterium]
MNGTIKRPGSVMLVCVLCLAVLGTGQAQEGDLTYNHVMINGEPVVEERDPRPNILLIMADDMGYSDIGCFGGEIQTPNLDQLAANGMRFTQFYNCAKCNPTRATLLTGQYNQAVGTANMQFGATFAEVLRPAGYRTLIAGKWHQNPLPTTRGFDRYFGLADGCCNYFNPGIEARPGEGKPGRKLKNGARRWAIEGQAIMGYTNPDKTFYTTDAFTNYAIDRLEEYKDEDKPFLLYMPYTAPHYPLHAWPEDIAKYRGKYRMGWDRLRETRYKRMCEMGILDPKIAALSKRDKSVTAWDTLTDAQKEAEDLNMAVYAAMIDRLDQNIGRVIAKLKALGKFDNTLILFLADNGGCAENVNTTPNIAPGPVESYRTVGPPWANASNTPYRKFKSTDFEGGNCTPFIVHWPRAIKPGQVTDQTGHIIDIMPTFMELAGASYPDELDGRQIKPLAGKSLVPVFQGKIRQPHDAIYWQYGQGFAIRKGNFKLVKLGKASAWELYDFSKDRTETNDLAAVFPERVASMKQDWEQWWQENKGIK